VKQLVLVYILRQIFSSSIVCGLHFSSSQFTH